jgi:hypothetical protein
MAEADDLFRPTHSGEADERFGDNSIATNRAYRLAADAFRGTARHVST